EEPATHERLDANFVVPEALRFQVGVEADRRVGAGGHLAERRDVESPRDRRVGRGGRAEAVGEGRLRRELRETRRGGTGVRAEVLHAVVDAIVAPAESDAELRGEAALDLREGADVREAVLLRNGDRPACPPLIDEPLRTALEDVVVA